MNFLGHEAVKRCDLDDISLLSSWLNVEMTIGDKKNQSTRGIQSLCGHVQQDAMTSI
jgi:hypothetical protein